MRPLIDLDREGLLNLQSFRARADKDKLPFIGGEVDYLSPEGEKITVEILRFNAGSDAYSFLTLVAKKMREARPDERMNLGEVGTAAVTTPQRIAFFKDTVFVRISDASKGSKASASIIALARLFADRIDKNAGDIPVLVKHLPGWETVQPINIYAVSSRSLRDQVSDQPIIDAISFEGGAEAVAANYGQSQLVIVEFNTPQLAGDNDLRIAAKIQELRKQGQSVPTAYRRVGNYCVFVFNAPDERTANQLIDQVKYQQVVQWLGNPPDNLAERRREFIYTTLGVFVSVVKASGVAIVLCVAVGGLLGALLFNRRRARQATAQAYSDAGGMLRLNIDELSAPTDAGKLIGPGKE